MGIDTALLIFMIVMITNAWLDSYFEVEFRIEHFLYWIITSVMVTGTLYMLADLF